MERMNGILRKCKSLSLSRMGRSSSYSSLRSKSTRDDDLLGDVVAGDDAVVFVGSSRRRYVVRAKHLNHPLMSALIDRSEHDSRDHKISVKCEVVLFDHLLWMLENADGDIVADGSLEELAELYAY